MHTCTVFEGSKNKRKPDEDVKYTVPKGSTSIRPVNIILHLFEKNYYKLHESYFPTCLWNFGCSYHLVSIFIYIKSLKPKYKFTKI